MKFLQTFSIIIFLFSFTIFGQEAKHIPEAAGDKANHPIPRIMSDSEECIAGYTQLIAKQEAGLPLAHNPLLKQNMQGTLAYYYFQRANLFFKNNDKEAAYADLKKGIEVDPSEMGYHGRSIIYRLNGMMEEALADMKMAVKLDTKRRLPSFVLDLGIHYFHMEKYTEAIATLEEAAKINDRLKEAAEKWIARAKQKLSETA